MIMSASVLLKLDGIDGESQISGYENQIELLSSSWGVSMAVSTGSGLGGGVGTANFMDVTVVKHTDKSSPNLFFACASGKSIDNATVSFLKAGGDSPVEYLKYEMT